MTETTSRIGTIASEVEEHAKQVERIIARHVPKGELAVMVVAIAREVAAVTTNPLDDAAVDVLAEALGVTREDEEAHAARVAAASEEQEK